MKRIDDRKDAISAATSGRSQDGHPDRIGSFAFRPGLMIAVMAFLAGVVPVASSSAFAGPAPKVRVRILDDIRSFRLRGFDLKFRASGTTLASGRGKDAPSVIPAGPSGLTSWGGKYKGISELRTQQSSALSVATARRQLAAQADHLSEWKISCPSGGVVHAEQIRSNGSGPPKNIYFPGPVSIESPSGFVTVAGKPYREKIMVHPIQTRRGWECETVNHVDIESYLDGLVNMEFSANWNKEAIDAQVIAARTYAYYQMMVAAKKPNSHFDLDSDVKDQVYDGSQKEDYRSKQSANRTRGMVLKANRRDSWPIKAYYHSTCGGMTELPQVVWGSKQKGFKTRVKCHYCRNSKTFVWDVPLTSEEVARTLWSKARDLSTAERDLLRNWPVSWERDILKSRLVDLRVTEQNASGRAMRVTSRWKNPEGKEFRLELPGTLFRSWIGPSRLKSTVFQVLAAGGNQWVLRGRGFGHGVGLCQWGTKTLGERGRKAKQILKFYYPDAVIARAW